MEFVCRLCNKRCKNAGGLARHVKTQHAKPPREVNVSIEIFEENPSEEGADLIEADKEESKADEIQSKTTTKAGFFLYTISTRPTSAGRAIP